MLCGYVLSIPIPILYVDVLDACALLFVCSFVCCFNCQLSSFEICRLPSLFTPESLRSEDHFAAALGFTPAQWMGVKDTAGEIWDPVAPGRFGDHPCGGGCVK